MTRKILKNPFFDILYFGEKCFWKKAIKCVIADCNENSFYFTEQLLKLFFLFTQSFMQKNFQTSLATWGRFYQRSTSSFGMHRSRKRKKIQSSRQSFLVLLGSVCIKAASRMLVKLTSGKQILFN